jgi:DNA polymerase-3 subunit delta
VKLAPSRIAAFLQRPDPETRAVLLYGPGAGLVCERAETIAPSVCPDLKDPFRVADLGAAVLTADPARLADEAAQLTLAGGRRVVQVRGAGDTVGKLFAEFLEEGPGDAFVVVEAGDLPSRSALRRAFRGSAARSGDRLLS